MADLDGWIGREQLAEDETLEIFEQQKYLAQHLGVRSSSDNPGFSSEVPGETLLGALLIRIDEASKAKTHWVALVDKADIKVGDKFVLVHNGRRVKLEVSGVNPRGRACEVELKNG
jgi:hypothetical protein